MSIADQALVKQEKVTGSNVNYYLQILADGTAVEAEDVIEYCDMRYAGGCTFKAVWRLCKIRQDLGKPGSTPLYEAEKGFYYPKREKVITERRLTNITTFGRMIRFIRDTFSGNPFYNPKDLIIEITDPKRLDPYSFAIGDLVDALQPTDAEAQVLIDVMTLNLMRKVVGPARKDELNRCDSMLYHSKRVVDREKLVAARVKTTDKG